MSESNQKNKTRCSSREKGEQTKVGVPGKKGERTSRQVLKKGISPPLGRGGNQGRYFRIAWEREVSSEGELVWEEEAMFPEEGKKS